MIGIDITEILQIQKKFETEITAQQSSALASLRLIDQGLFNQAERDYLNKIISAFSSPGFLTIEPLKLEQLALGMGQVPPSSRGKLKALKDFIIEALAYKKLRSSFYPKYFSGLNVKACVYCNSQLTVTINKTKNVFKARFDVDHYQPKDTHPFLAISLFNLYPVCASCNRAKGTRQVSFELYSKIPKVKSDFAFKLDPLAKTRYLTNYNSNDIAFKFLEPSPKPGHKTLQEVFNIQEIYEAQKDLLEELIIKSLMYNQTYKDQLRKTFSKLSLTDKLFERVLVGNYVDDKDINKRPLSKIMMDVARDLKII